MRILIIILLTSLLLPGLAQNYIPGYETTIAGEELIYHSPQPDATTSLLVRSEDSTHFIAWESVIIPPIPQPSNHPISQSSNLPIFQSILLLLAGIDVNPGDPHNWKVYVNDKHFFTITTPKDTSSRILVWPGPEGSSLVFKVKEVDKYGDFMGYLLCN